MESRRNQFLLKSYFQFRFGDRHLESVVHDVGRHRHLHSQVGHGRKCGGSHWNYVCMLVQTEVTSTRRKSSISPARVPLVFQLAPGTGKRYVHAENAQTSGIGPARNRFWPHFKIRTGRKNIREKHRGVRICTPLRCSRVKMYSAQNIHESQCKSEGQSVEKLNQQDQVQSHD